MQTKRHYIEILLMHPLLNIAIKAARSAGRIIVRAEEDIKSLTVIEKGKNDFVSQVDQFAEKAIIEIIQKNYPGHHILGEETGHLEANTQDAPTWIIDPLDGTTNFLHGIPHYAVSIAIVHQGKVQHGVVYDPTKDELYSASRGSGAQLNGKRIRVSKVEKFEKSLLATGIPFRDFHRLDQYMNSFKTIIPKCMGVRRAGSAALDLAYVAAGRIDGFWEYDLGSWDIAAGLLLVQEAGGFVSDINDEQNCLDTGNIIATTPKIFQTLKSHLS